ncbi:hypothetical protein Tco_0124722, partial [Tanacetum coccineum]
MRSNTPRNLILLRPNLGVLQICIRAKVIENQILSILQLHTHQYPFQLRTIQTLAAYEDPYAYIRVNGPPIMPEDPYAYIMAPYEVPPSLDYIHGPEVPPSPDYIPGPEELQSPPPLDFIPEPMYPEYIPQEDEILPAEEQPLPVAASPTTDPPGYVPESDLEEEPEKDDEDPEEDPADYPTNRDDDDDDDEDKDEDEEEEEEHPAPADSVPPVHRMTARIS